MNSPVEGRNSVQWFGGSVEEYRNRTGSKCLANRHLFFFRFGFRRPAAPGLDKKTETLHDVAMTSQGEMRFGFGIRIRIRSIVDVRGGVGCGHSFQESRGLRWGDVERNAISTLINKHPLCAYLPETAYHQRQQITTPPVKLRHEMAWHIFLSLRSFRALPSDSSAP